MIQVRDGINLIIGFAIGALIVIAGGAVRCGALCWFIGEIGKQ